MKPAKILDDRQSKMRALCSTPKIITQTSLPIMRVIDFRGWVDVLQIDSVKETSEISIENSIA